MELNLNYKTLGSQKSAEVSKGMIDWVRSFFENRVNSRWIDERRCIPPYVVMELANKGFFGLNVAEKNGGVALKAVDWINLIGQLGALDATISQLVAINSLAMRPLVSSGSDFLREKWLYPLAKGKVMSCFAQTEDAAGTFFTGIESSAVLDQSEKSFVLNGSKVWIGNAGWSSVMTVVSNVKSSTGEDLGMTAFAVATDSTGVSIGDELNTMGLRGVVQNRIHFKDVIVKPEDVIGEVGAGMSVSVDAMSLTRIVIAAQQIGLMKRAVQVAWKFVNRRHISTGPLVENSVALNLLSECVVRINSIENLVMLCGKMLDDGLTIDPVLSSACKVLSTEFAFFVTDTSLQLLGGRGYEENNILPQLVRDTRVTRIFEGPTEALLGFIGARFSGEYGYNLLRLISNSSDTIEQVIDEFEDKKIDIHSMVSEYPLDEKQQAQWLDYQCGSLGLWAILNAANLDYSIKSDQVEGWFDGGYALAPRFVAGSCIFSSDELKQSIDQYEVDIGKNRQKLPGLNQQLDDMLL